MSETAKEIICALIYAACIIAFMYLMCKLADKAYKRETKFRTDLLEVLNKIAERK